MVWCVSNNRVIEWVQLYASNGYYVYNDNYIVSIIFIDSIQIYDWTLHNRSFKLLLWMWIKLPLIKKRPIYLLSIERRSEFLLRRKVRLSAISWDNRMYRESSMHNWNVIKCHRIIMICESSIVHLLIIIITTK